MKELEEEKKKRKQQTETEAKALAIPNAKASCFENNDYKGMSVIEMAALLAWYNIPKEKMKSHRWLQSGRRSASTMFLHLCLRSGTIWMRKSSSG